MFGITMAESGSGEFLAPGPNSFDFSEVPLFHLGGLAVTKPMVQLLLGAVIVFVFFLARVTGGGGSIQGVFHFLHFVTFDERQRPGDAFIVAGAQRLDREAPVDRFRAWKSGGSAALRAGSGR